jgi:hypothetical protein
MLIPFIRMTAIRGLGIGFSIQRKGFTLLDSHFLVMGSLSHWLEGWAGRRPRRRLLGVARCGPRGLAENVLLGLLSVFEVAWNI